MTMWFEFYRFASNVSTNNSETFNHTDLKLSAVDYFISCLLLLKGFGFLRNSKNNLYLNEVGHSWFEKHPIKSEVG